MAGRKTKYEPARVAKILQAVEMGATYRLASAYAGVHEVTFERWRNRYADFAESLREAEGRAALKWLAQIEQASQGGDWRAAAWKLAVRYPHEYGKQVVENQLTGKDGKELTILIGTRPDGPALQE